jgi:ABC-type multidrug transport system permease subunit
VVRGGSLRIGVLAGFVASFIPTAVFFSGGETRTANLVGILLLLIAGLVAVPPSRRRTGVGAIAGLLVGAALAGVVALFTSLYEGFTHGIVF